MKKLLHWGPLIALFIIKCVSLTTLYYTPFWMSFSSSWLATLNYLIYYLLLISTLYNLLCAILSGPGYVPKGWAPDCQEDEQYLQYCHQCDAFKAPRSHHCSKCKRCVMKMDHHCPFLNNCCGFNNQKNFFYFLLSAVIGSIQSTVLLSITLYRALSFTPNLHHRFIYLTFWGAFAILLSIGMSIGVIIAVGCLLILQAKILLRNRTSIEDWILKKADLRIRNDQFIYPYDLGVWKNIKQVLFDPPLDGIEWPVKKGCHQYSLTYEQLQQKKDKMLHASLYRITKPYNGRCLPIFSQGIKVCLAFPLNDDPRIRVSPGDQVLVTHSYRHWLYGQIQTNDDGNKKRVKGWFPKQCGVLLVQPNIREFPIENSGDNKEDVIRSHQNDFDKKDL